MCIQIRPRPPECSAQYVLEVCPLDFAYRYTQTTVKIKIDERVVKYGHT